MQRRIIFGLIAALLVANVSHAQTSANGSLPKVIANENRTPTGVLRNNVLELRLELRDAVWYPEDENGGHRDIYAFAEQGYDPQSPGPLIRVPQGTEIHASIRNALDVGIKIYGLHRHPGDPKDALSVAANETRDVRFVVGEPGTYLYWAATSDHSLDTRDGAETMLSGAFIVDPPGAKPDDRIFVLGIWENRQAKESGGEIPSINGKSWPYGNHVTYKVGETVHWRILNPTFSQHGLHLHGFFFKVDGVGDGERYETYSEDQRPQAVTEFIDEGHVFDMTWTPERAGNWLFHCHMVAHMSLPQSLHPSSAEPASYSSEHAAGAMMGGLVVGISVLPKSNAEPVPVSTIPTHKVQLVISENLGKIPQYKLEVKDASAPTPEPSTPTGQASLIGPPIVLTRGEPAEIEVKNQTSHPTTIHWHGMELESYYDGVAGWTGTDQQPTPPIAPGGSFTARMTPPRAGTFIYHTHWHDTSQLLNGLYGPLIVLEPGEKYDLSTDRTFVFSLGKYDPFGYLFLINGRPEMYPIKLRTGTRYRLRLINITDNITDLRVRLANDDGPVQWKIIAKDGADLPASQLKMSKADMLITVGEAYDVEYQADTPGIAILQIWEASFPMSAAVPLKFSVPK